MSLLSVLDPSSLNRRPTLPSFGELVDSLDDIFSSISTLVDEGRRYIRLPDPASPAPGTGTSDTNAADVKPVHDPIVEDFVADVVINLPTRDEDLPLASETILKALATRSGYGLIPIERAPSPPNTNGAEVKKEERDEQNGLLNTTAAPNNASSQPGPANAPPSLQQLPISLGARSPRTINRRLPVNRTGPSLTRPLGTSRSLAWEGSVAIGDDGFIDRSPAADRPTFEQQTLIPETNSYLQIDLNTTSTKDMDLICYQREFKAEIEDLPQDKQYQVVENFQVNFGKRIMAKQLDIIDKHRAKLALLPTTEPVSAPSSTPSNANVKHLLKSFYDAIKLPSPYFKEHHFTPSAALIINGIRGRRPPPVTGGPMQLQREYAHYAMSNRESYDEPEWAWRLRLLLPSDDYKEVEWKDAPTPRPGWVRLKQKERESSGEESHKATGVPPRYRHLAGSSGSQATSASPSTSSSPSPSCPSPSSQAGGSTQRYPTSEPKHEDGVPLYQIKDFPAHDPFPSLFQRKTMVKAVHAYLDVLVGIDRDAPGSVLGGHGTIEDKLSAIQSLKEELAATAVEVANRVLVDATEELMDVRQGKFPASLWKSALSANAYKPLSSGVTYASTSPSPSGSASGSQSRASTPATSAFLSPLSPLTPLPLSPISSTSSVKDKGKKRAREDDAEDPRSASESEGEGSAPSTPGSVKKVKLVLGPDPSLSVPSSPVSDGSRSSLKITISRDKISRSKEITSKKQASPTTRRTRSSARAASPVAEKKVDKAKEAKIKSDKRAGASKSPKADNGKKAGKRKQA